MFYCLLWSGATSRPGICTLGPGPTPGIEMSTAYSQLRRRISLGILAGLLLLGQSVALSGQPTEAYRIHTPTEYYEWNEELKSCTGHDINIDEVEFYLVPTDSWYSFLNGHVNGEYLPTYLGKPPMIFLGYVNMYTEWLVKHEIIHHHLQVPGHPEPPYNDCEFRSSP